MKEEVCRLLEKVASSLVNRGWKKKMEQFVFLADKTMDIPVLFNEWLVNFNSSINRVLNFLLTQATRLDG
jgi:hypothetical protein